MIQRRTLAPLRTLKVDRRALLTLQGSPRYTIKKEKSLCHLINVLVAPLTAINGVHLLQKAVTHSIWVCMLWNHRDWFTRKDKISIHQVFNTMQSPPTEGFLVQVFDDPWIYIEQILHDYNEGVFGESTVISIAHALRCVLNKTFRNGNNPESYIQWAINKNYRLRVFANKIAARGNKVKAHRVIPEKNICLSCILCDANVGDEEEVKEMCIGLCDFLTIKNNE